MANLIKEPLKVVLSSALVPLARCLPFRSVPIVTYHSLDHLRSTISMAPRAFRRQMAWLQGHNFRTITFADFLSRAKSGEGLPPRTIVLTFDDGIRNVYEVAFPILQELRFVATVFLVTDCVGQRCSWELDAETKRAGVERLELMTWNEVREMQRAGHEFGSHGANHVRLSQVTPAAAYEDVSRSKHTMEDKLGTACRTFCYPYGDYNQTVRQIVQQLGLEGAVTTRFGRNPKGADPYCLKRIGSARFTSLPVFKACIYGVYGWHLRARRGS